jgi:glutamate racemase
MLGVYDSGVGGLTVVQELRRLMPQTSIIYVGDTARAPYGGKNPQTLFSHGKEIISFLIKKGATTIVMACGSSSSVSYEPLRNEFPGIPIVDTIRPAVKATLELAHQSPNFKPLLIATEATINSGLFQKLYNEATPAPPPLQARACPLFAPMVEAGLTTTKNHPLLNFAAENYLWELREKITAIILGCTHYPLLTPALIHTLGEITLINPATATAQAAKKTSPPTTPTPKITYYTSGNPKKFNKIAKFILNEKCNAKKGKFS